MTVRPIIFSEPMIRALLDGRKSQTRRVLKPQPEPWRDYYLEGGCQRSDWSFETGTRTLDGRREHFGLWMHCAFDESRFQRLPYAPGDLLWCREAWRTLHKWDNLAPRDLDGDRSKITYEADPERRNPLWAFGRLRPSIHMPRWASRLTLRVTDVRVQRLQDIREEDAIAEGVYRVDPTPEDLAKGCTPDDFVFRAPGTRQGWGRDKADRDSEQWGPDARFALRLLWNHLHGEDAWERNDWVAAISFDVIHANVDQVT